jgi:hypothetical protein
MYVRVADIGSSMRNSAIRPLGADRPNPAASLVLLGLSFDIPHHVSLAESTSALRALAT